MAPTSRPDGNPELLQQGAIRRDGVTKESIHPVSSLCAKESSEKFAVRTLDEWEAFLFHIFP